MSVERVAPAGKNPRRVTRGRGSAAESSPPPPAVQLDTRYVYSCPFCLNEANATYKLDRDGFPEWFIGCRKTDCDGQHLPSLSVALELDPSATKDQIAARVRGLARRTPRRSASEPLPSLAQLNWWEDDLWRPLGRPARRWLSRERLVRATVLRSLQVGWDASKDRLVFPMLNDGELVAAKSRKLGAGHQMRSWAGAGRAWPLYPTIDPNQGRGWVLLVAGEFDGLACLSRGVPATSVTLGAGNWREEWTKQLFGRRVVVCFDNNEQTQAQELVGGLRAAGVSAERLDLHTLGLDAPKGDLTDYFRGGGDPRRLRPRPRRFVRGGGTR